MKSVRTYFIDTSYLEELFKIPTRHDPAASLEIQKRVQAAMGEGAVMIVPAVCVLELGNHIAQLPPAQRSKYSQPLLKMPFTIVPAPQDDEFRQLLATWQARHLAHGRGLVDAAICERARAHKSRTPHTLVHILTKDRALKGVEPDPEPDPFTG